MTDSLRYYSTSCYIYGHIASVYDRGRLPSSAVRAYHLTTTHLSKRHKPDSESQPTQRFIGGSVTSNTENRMSCEGEVIGERVISDNTPNSLHRIPV